MILFPFTVAATVVSPDPELFAEHAANVHAMARTSRGRTICFEILSTSFLLLRLSSGGFGNFAALNTTGAHPYFARATLWKLDTNQLKIRIESARCPIVCMRNVIAELRALPANLTSFSHDDLTPLMSELLPQQPASHC
jgi:hypothetical protein